MLLAVPPRLRALRERKDVGFLGFRLCRTVLLGIAMPLKYLANEPGAVRIVGEPLQRGT
jgi:hypothetical protein